MTRIITCIATDVDKELHGLQVSVRLTPCADSDPPRPSGSLQAPRRHNSISL